MARAPREFIPSGPEDLTPEWLTQMLRERGVARGASVVGFEHEVVGEGQGFLGLVVRFHLTWDPPEQGVPASIIGKFPIQVAQNRGMAQVGGMYEKEVHFYRDLADRVAIRKPLFYYGAADANPAEGREEQIERWLSRVPVWLVKRAFPLLGWIGKRSKNRSALFIEDLAPARPGDQVAGCGAEEARVIVRDLAVMHAGWWQSPALDELTWIPSANFMARLMLSMVIAMRSDKVVDDLAERAPVVAQLVPWLDEHAVEMMERLASPPITLLHGDYRLDNMCLLGEGADVRVTVFDWQTMLRGRGPFDLAYFVTGNMQSEDAIKAEPELVSGYHSGLEAAGVRDYDLEECRRDYEIAKLCMFYRMMMANDVDFLDMGNERGHALFDTWIDRLTKLVPKDWERLLEP